MKITNIIGNGLQIEADALLDCWNEEEAEMIGDLALQQQTDISYDPDENVLRINKNHIPLSDKPPTIKPTLKHNITEIRDNVYYYL